MTSTGPAALVFHWPLEWVYACTFLEEAVKMAVGIPHFKRKQWMMNIQCSRRADGREGSSMEKLDLVVKIGSMALIQKDENAHWTTTSFSAWAAIFSRA